MIKMPQRKDSTAWGFKTVDVIRFGTDIIKVFYQDPKDTSINFLDYSLTTNRFTGHGQVVAPGKAVTKTPLLVLTWRSTNGQVQRIKVFWVNNDLLLRELDFDDGKNPKAGALNAENVKMAPNSPLAGTTFLRDGVANIRLYLVGSGRNLREWAWGASGQSKWVMSVILRNQIYDEWPLRLACINLKPWSETSPALRLFTSDYINKFTEYTFNEGWGTSAYPPELNFSPINNSFDAVATRLDTNSPRSFVFYVRPFKNVIIEKPRIGNVFETHQKSIELDRVHPFAVINIPKPDDPDHMHMFLTNGRDFIHMIRDKGTWSEKAVPQSRPEDDLTDVASIKASIGQPDVTVPA